MPNANEATIRNFSPFVFTLFEIIYTNISYRSIHSGLFGDVTPGPLLSLLSLFPSAI